MQYVFLEKKSRYGAKPQNLGNFLRIFVFNLYGYF